MTPTHRRLGALAACGALVLATGCSAAQDDQKTDPDSLKPSPVKKVDKDKQQAEATVTAYSRVVRTALQPGTKDVPIRRIRAVVAEPYATKLGKQLAVEHSQGLVMRGRDVYTTRSVSVKGDAATVVSCWDPTQANLVNTYAKPVEKVKPAKPNLTTFTLTRAPAGWKVATRKPGKPC